MIRKQGLMMLVALMVSMGLMAQEMPKIQKVDTQGAVVKQPAAQADVPNIVIAESGHDFGKIDKSQKVHAVIKFKNEGKAVLEILDVKTSCGCTSAKPEKRAYEPGESGEIVVTFNPSRFQGPITKTVTIMTNDPDTPRTMYQIQADIIVDVMVKPRVLFVQNLKRSETRTEKISIYSDQLDKLDLTDLACDRDFLTYELNKVDDKHYDLEVTIHGDKIAPDQKRVFGNFTYKTNSKGQENMQTRVHVTIQDPVEVQPPAIYLFGSKKGMEREIKVRLRSTVSSDLEIKDVEVGLTPAEANKYVIAEVVNDEKIGLSLKVKLSESAEKGKFQGTITLNTSLKEQPKVQIPIKGSVI